MMSRQSLPELLNGNKQKLILIFRLIRGKVIHLTN